MNEPGEGRAGLAVAALAINHDTLPKREPGHKVGQRPVARGEGHVERAGHVSGRVFLGSPAVDGDGPAAEEEVFGLAAGDEDDPGISFGVDKALPEFPGQIAPHEVEM